jgi:prepilin peptidase CpaA
VISVALHAVGVWGGGDGKLVAAIAAWKGLAFAAESLLWTFLAGGLIAAGILLWRRKSAAPRPSMVFGPLISIGAALAALMETLHAGGVLFWR